MSPWRPRMSKASLTSVKAEGTAVQDLLNPDRVLIGSLADSRSLAAADALASVYSWVPADRIVRMNLWSSELAKLAANCMLAQRISSINSLSAICEASGADISEVANAVGLDKRIGKHMLKASAGFGGSCFKKDVLSLVYIAQSLHLYDVARFWRSVVEINEYQKTRFTNSIISALHGTLLRKKIAIFGWAYKKNTGDTRESASITVASQLLAEGAELFVYDPQVSLNEDRIYADLDESMSFDRSRVHVCTDAVEACDDASAIVILTEWDHFKTDWLDLSALSSPAKESAGQDPPVPAGVQLDDAANWTAASSDSGIDVSDEAATSPAILALTQPCPSDRIDWRRIATAVRKPRLVFDGRNVVNARPLVALGFGVESIGKASIG
jgi:UDPglucose 6-dehydrogenase